MRIQGLQKTTLLDYPGHVAATIFLGGCNFRCPFCHNMNIVNESDGSISEEEILGFIKKRSGVIEGICITGGEPTLNIELPDFIKRIRDISENQELLVKLDTNGTNPDMVRELIDNKLVDYIAMDIKSSEKKYHEAAGLNNTEFSKDMLNKILQTIEILMKSNIEYEFRTTVVNGLHDDEAIAGIGEMIKGANKHFIQSFVDSEYVKDHTLKAFDKERLNQFIIIMKRYVKEAYLRGVD